MIDRKRTACFTGHRYIPEKQIAQIETSLDRIIEFLYQKGVIFYGAGGAYGFDMLAEKAVLKAKKKHPEIKLILVLPCKEQAKYWSLENKLQYEKIIKKADKLVYISENYYNGCMHKRNKHLVNYSGFCICYLTNNRGGTAFTVDYAKSQNLNIINLHNQTNF